MNIEEIRGFALSLPHASERCPFGPDTLSFEIGGKMFCLLDLSGKSTFYNVKVAPELGVELKERFACINPGYHFNKKHWVSIDLNSDLPPALEKEILRHAYYCTAKGLTMKVRRELGLTDGADHIPELY